jgi:hypothetical protein
VPGDEAEKIERLKPELDRFARAGGRGFFAHGFSTELNPSVFAPYARECAARGLLCGAVYGMNASDMIGKGERIGAVGAMPECFAIGMDEEGAGDNIPEQFVIDLGNSYRAHAPKALTFTQPWPLTYYHPHFRYRAFARFTDCVAPQFYWLDWVRSFHDEPAAYATMMPKFEADWARREKEDLGPAGLIRPRFPTIEGRQVNLASATDCMRKYKTLVAWCEWKPSDVFYAAMAATKSP